MTSGTISFSRQNNFDLIRLLAASQVVLVHTVEHLDLSINPALWKVISSIPGVPIFFVISGFLITASYQRQPSLRHFFRNRILRIFPALWACLAVSIIAAWSLGGFDDRVTVTGFLGWVLAQLSFVQFYNPIFLRDYGVGVLNGSLWTIPVELQFYVLTPLLILIFTRVKALFWLMFAGFVVLNLANSLSAFDSFLPASMVKLLLVTFIPWIAMFMVGALLQIYYPKIRFWIDGRAIYWIALYACAIALSFWVDIGISGNYIAVPWSILLAVTACSCAFSFNGLSQRIVGKNDVSYGAYIYHMPVINAVITLNPETGWMAASLVFVTTFILAFASWKFVEKPSLGIKSFSINSLQA